MKTMAYFKHITLNQLEANAPVTENANMRSWDLKDELSTRRWWMNEYPYIQMNQELF